MLYGATAAANRGGPYVQNYLVVETAAEIETEVTYPSPLELLNDWKKFWVFPNQFGDGMPAGPGATYQATATTFYTTSNANPFSLILAPEGVTAVYQSTRIQGTPVGPGVFTDDDVSGLVLGVKETESDFYVLWLDIEAGGYRYNNDGPVDFPWFHNFENYTLSYNPTVALAVQRIPKPFNEAPDYKLSYATLIRGIQFSPDVSNKSGLNGWGEWGSGIGVISFFNGEILDCRVYKPNLPMVDSNILVRFYYQVKDTPDLQGFKPSAGLLNSSQENNYWNNYAYSPEGALALNLETQTLWGPADGSFPPTSEDKGIPISDLILPGRYARSEKNNRWLKVNPYTKIASLSGPAPFI